MGVNISLHYEDGTALRGWDCSRHSGDLAFSESDLPTEHIPLDTDYGVVVSWGLRPKDFAAWRDRFACEGAENAERFKTALDFLEANRGSFFIP